jgi:imidazolonepropionase
VKPGTAELLIRGVHLADFSDDCPWPQGELRDAALVVRDGRIAWLGPERTLPTGLDAQAQWQGDGAWLTPGLIDCHTHLVWAGNRAGEFEARLTGVSYADIARAGGGIQATVRTTRAASEDALFAASLPRLQALMADGLTTVEIKSGYGLQLAAEARCLRVARRLGTAAGVTVRTTFLGAHALPPECAGRGDDYIAQVADTMLPALHAEKLVDAVDAFCEAIGFSAAQTRRVFERARALGLPVKLHADQLSDGGGAALAAEFGALSADHIEYADEAGIAAMARAGTVAVLLPGAFYNLRETRLPPIDALRSHGVPMAVSTDCNPGTSPFMSLRWMMHMACTLFRLTPREALAGVTVHAARALGLADRGALRTGMRADLACWHVEHPRDLVYQQGDAALAACWVAGKQR